MNKLTMADLNVMVVKLSDLIECERCGISFGGAGTQTLSGIMQEVSVHRDACPSWPSPRSRTAQCRPMAGQTAIPLPK